MTVMRSGVTRFVVKRCKAGNLGHGTLTANFLAGCSSCSMTNSFVAIAVLIERAGSC